MPTAKIKSPKATRPYMPGYGLPKHKKGMLTWKWATTELAKTREYWIVTVRPNRAPHMMPVWGLWWDNAFYFSTGAGSRKDRNLAKNAKCVIATQDASKAVVVEGTAAKLRDVAKIRKFLPLYEKKYKFDMSGMAGDLIALKQPIFVVRPKKAFGMVEKTFATSATRWLFS